MASQRKQSTSQITAKRWKSRIQHLLLVCFLLQLIIVGTGLYYTDNLNFIFSQKNDTLHVADLGKNNPVEEKDTTILDINETVVQPQKIDTLETLTDKQRDLTVKPIETYPKETLPLTLTSPPPQASHTAMNNEKNRTEIRVSTIKNINTTVDTAEKREKTTTKMSISSSHEQVSQGSTTKADSKHRPQVLPAISQSDGSAPVAITATERTNQEQLDHYFYTVKAGDTLGLISKEVYGTFTQWPVIANANTVQLGNNPNKLQPGMKLIIPTLTKTMDMR